MDKIQICVKTAKSKHRAIKITMRQRGRHADQTVSNKAKHDTDTAVLMAKASYENNVVKQSTDDPKDHKDFMMGNHVLLYHW